MNSPAVRNPEEPSFAPQEPRQESRPSYSDEPLYYYPEEPPMPDALQEIAKKIAALDVIDYHRLEQEFSSLPAASGLGPRFFKFLTLWSIARCQDQLETLLPATEQKSFLLNLDKTLSLDTSSSNTSAAPQEQEKAPVTEIPLSLLLPVKSA